MGEFHNSFFIQSIGHGQCLRVIGDGNVFITHLTRGGGHFFQSRPAVGSGGVHVNVTTHVAQFHQMR